ncbi:hypothetical protein N0V85_009090 [Neurospora sp. IMI 360204]|nr:hypothetical protein N0V85_009090 [Neurospora sp. IMI 360204]
MPRPVAISESVVPSTSSSGYPKLVKRASVILWAFCRSAISSAAASYEQARVLNSGEDRLEEVLVLRVTDGRDYFIPVRGVWMPTCIGRSIDELIRVPEGGLRKFVHALTEKNGGKVMSVPEEMDVHCAAPRELFKLTKAEPMREAPQGFRVRLNIIEIGNGCIDRIHVTEPLHESSVASMSDLLLLRAVTVVR